MPSTEEFLRSLDDTELAFLVKYKASTYLRDSQLKIVAEIIERKLEAPQLEQMIREIEFNSSNNGCPRCNSMKSLKEKAEVWRRYADLDDALIGPRTFYNEICAVCGYKIKDVENNPPTVISEFLERFTT